MKQNLNVQMLDTSRLTTELEPATLGLYRAIFNVPAMNKQYILTGSPSECPAPNYNKEYAEYLGRCKLAECMRDCRDEIISNEESTMLVLKYANGETSDFNISFEQGE